ncbi:Predicted flavoprotein CzcO associated with the cation diffusion facilitator CzcD [Pseudomonas sp. ok272]|uniref:flavin-containing monooxygenase n=1 Tax=unclassified Pseudomonas TaxID=196821 RepID=UPI0008B22AA1|nr:MULTISPECIES: NAD(P)/FAD-dependent oxidoreductase [unclassified Pseudomonas]SEN58925.1 Predicted flavoprotein CzcO associated with the cation diffusion facilitator CzcD [Pseudomonas sp. ok272]SFN37553.1 Predicted flavoprotein CzcO associated with the cation diffusion facilitator CzcD [Pseudomonas sp. ok602]
MQTYHVLIIGSGFGGQCAAVNLLKAGIEDFRILERRDFFGGTWCQNTYPGAAVDVPSPLYSLSFAPYPWTRLFAEQAELHRYTQHVADRYQLRDKVQLQALVERVEWDDEQRHWRVYTASQGTFCAAFLINASGPLSQPLVPSFEGLQRFAGRQFHSNAWDHAYDYRDKRVAIVGSGASAAQIIPALAPDVAHLHVFQRTPHWVLPRADRRFGRFQRWLLGIKPAYTLLRWLIYWQFESRVIAFKYSRIALKLVQQKALKHLKQQVPDEHLRQTLTPDFTFGCKRVILSSTLYPALSRDNVSVHGREQGITSLDETGINTVDGQHIDLDLIVWATGYDATDGAIPYPVRGKGGALLADAWAHYPRAYLGTSLPGFPNLFMILGPNTGIGHTSALFIIESQMNYILGCLRTLKAQALRSIEVRQEAESAYTRMIHQQMQRTVWKSGGCHSWYQSRSGHVIALFPGFSFSYYQLTRRVKLADHILS